MKIEDKKDMIFSWSLILQNIVESQSRTFHYKTGYDFY